jgi:hypothetical protein
MGFIPNVNSSRIRMGHFQADVLGLYLARQLPALFSIPARRAALGPPTICLGLLPLVVLPGHFHGMLSSLFEIAARPGRRNLHNLSSGVEPRPFSRPTAATIFLLAYHRSHAEFRAQTRHGKHGLNCRATSA